MHEQVCRFYQLSKNVFKLTKSACEARPVGSWMRKPSQARSTSSVCDPGPLRPDQFRLGPPGPSRSLIQGEAQIEGEAGY